jgi:rhodanese-related sulfurtransferase
VKIKLSTFFILLVAFSVVLNSRALAHIDVNSLEAKNIIDSNDQLIVIDVRELSEYCAVEGHIHGALNYPWGSGILQQWYEELPRDGEILVYCRSGYRSNLAAEFLDANDFLYVYDMVGGFSSWQWETTADGDGGGDTCDQNCPDLDGFNPVNFIDYSVLMQNWQVAGPNIPGDLNMDNVVDVNDLAILSDYWLSECYEEYTVSKADRLSTPVRGEDIQICHDDAIEDRRYRIIMNPSPYESRTNQFL